MKGQIFIIASILTLLALFITRLGTQIADIKQGDLFYESFSNLKNELIKTVDLALINQEDVPSKLEDFIDFSKDVLSRKGYTENVVYSIQTVSANIVYINVSLSSKDYYLVENLIINRTVYT